MFQVGAFVAHPGHGGCVVDDVYVRPWEGAEDECYRLRPITAENCQVYVPIRTAEEIGLRPVMTTEAAQELLSRMPGLEAEWQTDFKKRRQLGVDTLKQNDVFALSRMVKAYMCANVQSQNTATDRELFAAGKKKLVSELALALGENVVQMEQIIADKMRQNVLPA